MDEANALVSKVKSLIKEIDMDKFDWGWTVRNQGNFDIKMMTSCGFRMGSHRKSVDVCR